MYTNIHNIRNIHNSGCPRDAAADPADEPGQLAAQLRLVRLPARSRDQDQAQVTEFTHLSGDKQCTFLLFSFSYSGYVEGWRDDLMTFSFVLCLLSNVSYEFMKLWIM